MISAALLLEYASTALSPLSFYQGPGRWDSIGVGRHLVGSRPSNRPWWPPEVSSRVVRDILEELEKPVNFRYRLENTTFRETHTVDYAFFPHAIFVVYQSMPLYDITELYKLITHLFQLLLAEQLLLTALRWGTGFGHVFLFQAES